LACNWDRQPATEESERGSFSGHCDRSLRPGWRRIDDRQALEAERVVAQSGERFMGARETAEDLGWEEKARLLSHGAKEITEYEPARSRFSRSLARLREALHPSAKIRNGALFFREIGDWEDDRSPIGSRRQHRADDNHVGRARERGSIDPRQVFTGDNE